MVHLGLCHLVSSLWWTASASSSFYSPVQYFGIASEHNGMSYPHQSIAITNNNGIVIGGWFGSSNYFSSTYEYTHCHKHARLDTRRKQGMQRVEVRKLGAHFSCSYLHLAKKNQESSRKHVSLTTVYYINKLINEI